ncbi:MAG TPA: NHL repeat-containing protein [Acidobacteriaceae bacterium]|nr:NHL repeat-containing protein [Acidobacteriaceae bacterium]
MIAACAAVYTAALAGCGTGISAAKDASPAAVTAAARKGVVMGGQQPVAGVALQLYQAGSAGYGSAATPLGGVVHTNAQGNFDLPSYNCAAGSQVYLVGTGGMPTAVLTNNNLALMVGLGTCGGTYLNGFINMNELTTVATVWALAPFMKDATHIGASATNAAGLADAFAAINQLVTTATGTVPGPLLPAGATLNATEIYTLGDILEQCVNSGGGVAGDLSACGNLFSLAPNAAGTVYPADAITAAMNIAQSPGRNVAGLNKLRSAQPVFEPSYDVNSPPNDWTIAITYTGGGLNAPSAIATDASGNAWIANSGNASVTELSSAGAALSGANGFTAGGFNVPSAIAIDTGGNAWVANAGNSTVTKLSADGATGTVLHGNGLSAPASIAIDGNGDVWVANAGTNAVSGFTSSGAALTGSPFSGAGVSAPVSVAVTPK